MRNLTIFGAIIVAFISLTFSEDANGEPRPTREQINELAFLNGSWLATPSEKDKDGKWKEMDHKGFVNFEFTLDRNQTNVK